MSSNRVTAGQVILGSGATLMARVNGNAGDYITQASLSTVTVEVFNLDGDGDTAVYTDSGITVSDVIFDTLQTSDSRWTSDDIGYNFRYTLAGSAMATQGRYLVKVAFDPVVGDDFTTLYSIWVIDGGLS